MTEPPSPTLRFRKHPGVVLIALGVWSLLLVGVMVPWIYEVDRGRFVLSIGAHISAAIWWLVLLWALHHLVFQLGGLFRAGGHPPPAGDLHPQIAILYTTCDDFCEEACRSCLDQDYDACEVVICDDSQEGASRKQVEAFCQAQDKLCRLSRRGNRQGFKAGNLNHALRADLDAEWVLLVDADQILPRDYVSRLVACLPSDDEGVAFVQGSQVARTGPQSSPMQRALAPGVAAFYFRDLPLRIRGGFFPMLGHGVMLRRSALEAAGGFPELVSEDFALALALANRGVRGVHAQHVLSREAVPYDFGGFMVRLKKFAGGTAELLRTQLLRFLCGPASWAEKWDFVMMAGWYGLMVLVVANGFLASNVCYHLYRIDAVMLHPLLPYVFLWLLLSVFVVGLSVVEGFGQGVRYYFWSTAIHSAAMPLAGWAFLKHLFRPAVFERTPKNHQRRTLAMGECVFMVALGLAAVVLSMLWLSPFTPYLAGQGVAYLSYPLYGRLGRSGVISKLTQVVVYLPGILMVVALAAMWMWGYR